MSKCWCTAEAWGTGPISKLSAITALYQHTRQGKFTFISDCNEHFDYFLAPLKIDSRFQPLAETRTALLPGDCLISVMHPRLALIAKWLGLKVLYVDSLAWFWKIWDEVDLFYYTKFLDLVSPEKTSFQDLMAVLRYANLYDLHWAAHIAVDMSAIQRFIEPSAVASMILNYSNAVHQIGAIVDPRLDSSTPVDESVVVVSLGGSHANPLYVRWSSEVFSRVAVERPDYFFYLVQPGPVPKFTSIRSNLVLDTRPRANYLELLNKAGRVYSPPGLTFFLESCVLGHTLTLLPPQHAGQQKNMVVLTRSVPELIALHWPYKNMSTEAIVSTVGQELKSSHALDKTARIILESWNTVHQRGDNQHIQDFLQSIGTNGAAEAAALFESLCNESL